jgi:hypothetical protein
MKLNKNIILALIIGFVIGGVTVGLVDMNRPKPIFTSASVGHDSACGYLMDSLSNMKEIKATLDSEKSDSSHMDQAITATEKMLNECLDKSPTLE